MSSISIGPWSAPPARLVDDGRGCRVERGGRAIELDHDEAALLGVLIAASSGDDGWRAFVRTATLTAQLVPAPAFAVERMRAIARRLERHLASLGEPALLERCERRGYRVRADLR